MATFLERAAHSVNPMFSLYTLCLLFSLVVSHFGFYGGTLVLIAPVSGHCLPSSFHIGRIMIKIIIPVSDQCQVV